mgnify:CR=1 FL=1
MITPSLIDVKRYFVGSSFGKSEKETIARNIVILSQVVAYVEGNDSWHPFTLEDYIAFREANNPKEPVEWKERGVLSGFVSGGYLEETDAGLQVTDAFIQAVGKFSIDPLAPDSSVTYSP